MKIENCPNCGGTHFGSIKCPFIKAPCCVCGTPTILTIMECGHYNYEQRDDGPGLMTLTCLVCGHVQHLHSHRDEGEDKWRDDRDDDRRRY